MCLGASMFGAELACSAVCVSEFGRCASFSCSPRLDIDPEYMAANRAKGKHTDRDELGMIEASIAYGCVASSSAAHTCTSYACVCVADPCYRPTTPFITRPPPRTHIPKHLCALLAMAHMP